MEYGLISRINQYVDNNQLQIQQVQPSNKISGTSASDENNQVLRDSSLKGIANLSNEKISETKEVSSQKIAQYQEVALTNLNFGFNDSSRDFYVKAIRGEAQNQYPTDQMMKLKAFFIAEAKAQNEAALNN